jgi:hypothetical protein
VIELFPSRLEGLPLETHETHETLTLDAWLTATVKDYEPREVPPISAEINGVLIPSADWMTTTFGPSDSVQLFVEPKGKVNFFSIDMLLLGGIRTTLNLLKPKMPSQPNMGAQGQGSPLDEASSKGNKIKLNSIIPERAGFGRIYPDSIMQGRRYFRAPREQWVELLLCVGVGEFDIPTSKIKVGETPLVSLGDDASFAIYGPGEYVGGESASQFWYSAKEVGASSSGAAGLELTVGSALTGAASASVFQFNGDTITIPTGAGTFPTDWEDGLLIRVIAPYSYTVTDGTGPDGRDVIGGDIIQLGLVVGDSIEIAGSNAGIYTVHTVTATDMTLNYAGGAPATGLVPGAMVSTIGPVGLRFRIVAAGASTMQVERLKSSGSITDEDWPGWTLLETGQAYISLDSSNLEGGYRGPITACPDGELATHIEYDVFFANGLIGIGREGQKYEVHSEHQFEYRDVAVGGAWTVITQSCVGGSLDAQGFTYRVELPYPMRPECQIKRLPVTGYERPDEVNDKCMWYGLRTLLPAPTSYAGVTIMAVYVRGGDRLSSESENMISCEATRILPNLDGIEEPTRDIAPWFLYVAKSVGYTEADIDMVELLRLHDIWSARIDHFNLGVTSSGTVKSALNDALRAGYAELILERGKIKPVRDEPRTVFKHMYSTQNATTTIERPWSAPTIDDFDGVDVEYLNMKTWQKETIKCRLPGDAGLRVEKISLEGVIYKDKAYQIGMRQRSADKYRRKSFIVNTELSGLNSGYGDYIGLADDVPGYAQSSILQSWAPMGGSVLLVSSEPFDWSGAGPYLVSLRRQDGTLSGPYVASRIDDYRLTVSALDFMPDTTLALEPPHMIFGMPYAAIVTDVSPKGTTGARVSATNYDERVYAYDNAFAP